MQFIKITRLLGLTLALAPLAGMAQTFPTRPVVIFQSSSPGSGPDTFLRAGVRAMSEALGQTVVVEARPGAQGTVASMAVKSAPADGYTLLFNHSGNLIMDPLLTSTPFDVSRDFKPISVAYYTLGIIAVPASGPIKSLADLVTQARAKPTGLFYGSPSTSSELVVAMISQAIGAKLVSVPYKGVPEVMTDVAGGRVDFGIGTPQPTVRALAEAGKLRIVGLLWPSRIEQLPYPTLVESGIPVQRTLTWFGLLAPAGTPNPVAQKIHQAFTHAFGLPEVRQAALQQGAAVTLSESPEDFSKLIEADKVLVARIIKETGLKTTGKQ